MTCLTFDEYVFYFNRLRILLKFTLSFDGKKIAGKFLVSFSSAESEHFIRKHTFKACQIKGNSAFEVLPEDGCARVPLIAFSCLKRGVAWKIWPTK
jgi:hypothetical protein